MDVLSDEGALRILHVDDDILDHHAVAQCVQAAPMPCLIHHVLGVSEIVEALRQGPADVLLLDLNMGWYRRLEALSAVQELGVKAPVVVLTGDADPTLGIEAIRHGAEDFLSKDELDPYGLWKTLVHSRARWKLRQASPQPEDTKETPRTPGRVATSGPLEAGALVDRYVVEQVVGRGGMATVYRVRHKHLGSVHALKAMVPREGIDPGRLTQEGQLQARLRHRNLVTVTDVLELENGGIGLVMEYVAGPNLYQWFRALPDRAPQRWLGLFRDLVRGVRHAHQHGLVHRDLKPANVLLQQSEDGLMPKITDFGVAKILDCGLAQPSFATQVGIGLGTPGYMAPEQIDDASSVDQRADLFSLGCMMYMLACGERPFQGASSMAVLLATMRGEYQPPRWREPDMSLDLARLITWLLAKDRDARLPDCQTLLEALDDLDIEPMVYASTS